MSAPFRTAEPYRLRLSWRRSLVSLAGICGIVLAAVHIRSNPLAAGGYVLSLLCATCALSCLWLLADCVWPWVGGDRVTAEERAHADASLRHAYAWLVALAVGGLVYLLATDARPELRLMVPEQFTVVLWCIAALIVLLPFGLYAWGDAAGIPGAELNPLQLIRARFTGPSAILHWATLGIVVTSFPVLLFGSRGVGVGRGLLANAALLLAGSGVVVGLVVAVRHTWSGHRSGGDHRGP